MLPPARVLRLRTATGAAALLLACGASLVACGGSSPRRAGVVSGATAVSSGAAGRKSAQAASVGALLTRVLPRARLLTVVDLRLARAELGLGAGPLVGDHGSREGQLTRFGLLALPLIDDRALFDGLDLARISAAVQFGGVQHSGLLIATSQSPSAIASGLLRAGWRPEHGGFRYLGQEGDSELSHSKVDLFDGGLVLAYSPADADRAAAQTRVPSSDSALIRLVQSSDAPARFAAVDSGCIASELAQERLTPHVGSISIMPRGRPRASDLTITADAKALASAGLVIQRVIVQARQVVIDFRYAARASAPPGAVIEVAREAPLYRCGGG